MKQTRFKAEVNNETLEYFPNQAEDRWLMWTTWLLVVKLQEWTTGGALRWQKASAGSNRAAGASSAVIVDAAIFGSSSGSELADGAADRVVFLFFFQHLTETKTQRSEWNAAGGPSSRGDT